MILSGEGWTAEDLPSMENETVVVTGANSGIGFEATRAFARKGATVIMACRNMERAGEAREDILEDFGEADLRVRELDLADLSTVRSFAEEIRANHDEIDVLCNNAGIMGIPREETEDGFEKQMGVNHLGHFALTGLLLDLVENAGGRIVTQSSGLHRQADIDFDDLMLEEEYDAWRSYANSKLANLLFAYQLDLELKHNDHDAISVACHPGYSNTRLQERVGEKKDSGLMKYGARVANRLLAQPASKGALPMLYAATSPDAEGGDFIGPDGLFEMRGYPEKQRSSQESYDMTDAEELWELSEELTEVEIEL